MNLKVQDNFFLFLLNKVHDLLIDLAMSTKGIKPPNIIKLQINKLSNKYLTTHKYP